MFPELQQYYVAFLDVLGFSEMVKSDVGKKSSIFLTKLFRCHQGASHIFGNDPSCSITQFSDSVVVARPYEAEHFESFVSMVAKYQRLLLDEELLCRGGIAVNKHFSNGSFTFSAGLIDAYRVESESARFPRVVVSPEVIELIYPDRGKISSLLVREDDGLFFVDYMGITAKTKPKKLSDAVANVVKDLMASSNPSVREKGMWLASYSDAVLGTVHKSPRFTGKQVRTERAYPHSSRPKPLPAKKELNNPRRPHAPDSQTW